MASIADVIKFTPTLGGLTDWTLATAATGYRTPSGNLTNGSTYSYRAQSSDNSEWEVGTGAWTSATSTLARTTVLYSSTGAKVNFTVAPSVAVVALTADVAPPDADYLVKTAHGGLSAERVVTDGAAAGKVNWDWSVGGVVKGVLYASAADKFLYATAANTWAEGAITAAGRALLDDANAAAQLVTLGLGTPTGTGNVVLATSPTLVTPVLGTASCTSLVSTGTVTVAIEGSNGGFLAYAYGAGVFPLMSGRAGRGTAASPSAVQSGDTVMRVGGTGYGATAMPTTNNALLGFIAEENFTDSARGTRIVFETTPIGSTSSSERMRIDNAGYIGIGTTSPSTTLHVNGPIRCASYTVATLPSASTVGAGARAFVTDANATTFNSTVAAGGANAISVTSDGTNWKIG